MTSPKRLLRGSYRNILECYERADESSSEEGRVWYLQGRDIAFEIGENCVLSYCPYDYTEEGQLAENILEYHELVQLGAGIIASLSPQTSWDKNIEGALYFSKTLEKPKFTTDVNYNKALDIFHSVMLKDNIDIETILGEKAYKTKAFYNNICNPDGDYGVTIDRHAISIYLGKSCTKQQLSRGLDSKRTNDTIRNSYKKVADMLGIHYNILQATTWVQWRKER